MKARTARGRFRLRLRTLAPLGLLGIVAGTAACLPYGPSPHTWTRSYYVANPSPEEITKLGCFNSDVSGRMTLFFGAPVEVNGTFGTTLWGGQDRTVWEIGELVKEFVRGFAWCRTGGQQILVGMGTSNSGADNKPDEWIAGHGHTWAAVVAGVADWAAVTYQIGRAHV